MISNESILLSQLMPINCTIVADSTALNNQLSNYKGLVGLTQTAIRRFLNGELPDPLVGENACQARASFYCRMAQDRHFAVDLQKVAMELDVVSKSLETMSIPASKKPSFSLSDVLEKNQANLVISKEIAPIVFGHMLTAAKQSELKIANREVTLNEGVDHKLLAGFAIGFAKDLVKKGRRELSEYTIHYLRNESSLLPMTPTRERIMNMIRNEEHVLTDPLGLRSAPMFEGMQILLESMKVNHIAILLKERVFNKEGDKELETFSLLFKPNEKGLYEEAKANIDEVGCVIEATLFSDESKEKLKSSLLEVGIEKIILANAAAHPQYGGTNKHVEPPQSAERENFKTYALEHGLCAAKPNLCRIYHVFPAHLGKEVCK